MGEPTNSDIIELLRESLANSERIHKKTQENFKEIKQELISLKTSIQTDIEAVKKENHELKEKLAHVESKLLTCERNQKKYNIIAYGLPEAQEELSDIQTFIDLINTKLGVHCCFTDLRDIYRIGKKLEGVSIRPRPLVVELINYKLKLAILEKTRKLKGTNIVITKDLPHEDYQVQKVLHSHLKKARANQFDAHIKNNLLVVNGDEFTYQDLIKDNTTNTKTPADAAKDCITDTEKNPLGSKATSKKPESQEQLDTNINLTEASGFKRKIKNSDLQQPNKRTTRSTTAHGTNYFS